VTIVEAAMQDLLGCLGCCWAGKLEVHKALHSTNTKQTVQN
jgi:hypothetical protein